MDRSHLDADLELEGSGGAEGMLLLGGGGAVGHLSFAYTPLKEEDTGYDVDCFWLDYGGGFLLPLSSADSEPLPFVRWAVGPSLMFLDFEHGAEDTFGLGTFGRVSAGVVVSHSVGVEVFGDLHAWVGTDSDDAQAAWAASLGAGFLVIF